MSYTATRTDKDYSPSYTVSQPPKQGVYTWGWKYRNRSLPALNFWRIIRKPLQAESDKASLRSAETFHDRRSAGQF